MSHKSRSSKKSSHKKHEESSSDDCDTQRRSGCDSGCRADGCPTPSISTAMCQRDCDPLLKVVDSRAIGSAATYTALSPDGTQAISLLSTFLGSVVTVPIDFQLFNNNCGVLTPTETRLPENATNYATTPSLISNAAVAFNFRIAAGIYEYVDNPTDANSLGTGFVDVFDPSNPTVNLFSFPLVNNVSETFLPFTTNTKYLTGISSDNRYLTLSYQTAIDQGVVQVYDLRTGELVAEGFTNGFSNGPSFFDLCQSKNCDRDDCGRKNKHRSQCVRRRFVAIGSNGLNAGVNLAPAIFQIFELRENSLFEVARESTSSQLRSISVPTGLCCPPETLIAISTTGVIPGQPTLYTNSPAARNSLNGQIGGVTIFRFNGERLREVARQPVELGFVNAVGFTPNGKYLAIAFGTSASGFAFPSFFQLFRVVNQDDCSVCLYPLDIPRPSGQQILTLPFSLNGKWLIVSGGIVNSTPPNPNFPLGLIKNFQVYQLVYPECCPDQCGELECIKQNACNTKKACKTSECNRDYQISRCNRDNRYY